MKCYVTDEHRHFAEEDVQTSRKEDSVLRITEQKIAVLQGFGGCFNELGYKALCCLREEDRKALMDDLFNEDGCNFSYCRLPVGANDFSLDWYSYDETEGDYSLRDFSVERDEKTLLPYVREALSRRKDLLLFASPWSPPTWLKTNGKYNGGRLKTDKRSQKTYAKYLSAYLSEYEKRGVHIHFLHPQNEVTADQSFPSCLYTGEEFKNFVAGYLCAEISRNNPGTQIWLGTINSQSFEDYAFRFFEDKKLSRKIGGIGYQWIGKESVCKTRASFPRVPIVQTESECGDGENTFAFAEYIFSLMQHYLTNGAEAYVYWNMILGSDPHSTWDWAQNSLITVDENSRTWRKNPEYWLMKHFSAFLHRGDETVRCTGAWSGNSVAARRADGSRVLVVHNPLGEERVLRIDCGKTSIKVCLAPNAFHSFILND